EKQPRFPGNNQAGATILGTFYPLQDAKSLNYKPDKILVIFSLTANCNNLTYVEPSELNII
ncbi:MAG: hypothetical protein WCL32_19095, partial [Planctomycetota bacterium]